MVNDYLADAWGPYPFTLHVNGFRLPREIFDHEVSNAFPGIADVNFYRSSVLMGETLGWFVFSGMLQKYPDLHIVMTEGYAAWLGFATQFYDHHTQESRYPLLHRERGQEGVRLEAPPSYFLTR